jgi:hypothetical protein
MSQQGFSGFFFWDFAGRDREVRELALVGFETDVGPRDAGPTRKFSTERSLPNREEPDLTIDHKSSGWNLRISEIWRKTYKKIIQNDPSDFVDVYPILLQEDREGSIRFEGLGRERASSVHRGALGRSGGRGWFRVLESGFAGSEGTEEFESGLGAMLVGGGSRLASARKEVGNGEIGAQFAQEWRHGLERDGVRVA